MKLFKDIKMIKKKSLTRWQDPTRSLVSDLDFAWREVAVDPADLDTYYHNDSFTCLLEECKHYDESILNALDKCISQLTDKQQIIVNLYLEGKTQEEISKSMGVSQGAVSLAWSGIFSYKQNSKGKKYGGILKALKKKIEKELEDSQI